MKLGLMKQFVKAFLSDYWFKFLILEIPNLSIENIKADVFDW